MLASEHVKNSAQKAWIFQVHQGTQLRVERQIWEIIARKSTHFLNRSTFLLQKLYQ